MLSIRQFRDTITHRTTGITTKIILEIVVQRICLRHFPINNQLQIMSDTTSSGIDTIFVIHLCHEVGRRINAASIDKRRTIKIAVYVRSDSILRKTSGTAHYHLITDATGLHGFLVIDSIEIKQSVCIRIADILWYSKREREASVLYQVTAIEQDVGTIIEYERFTGLCRIIQLTDHPFQSITDNSSQRPIERGSLLSVRFCDMTSHYCRRTGIQCLCLATYQRLIVDRVYLNT